MGLDVDARKLFRTCGCWANYRSSYSEARREAKRLNFDVILAPPVSTYCSHPCGCQRYPASFSPSKDAQRKTPKAPSFCFLSFARSVHAVVPADISHLSFLLLPLPLLLCCCSAVTTLCVVFPVRYLDIPLPYEVEDDSKCSAARDKAGLLKITMPVRPPPAPAPAPEPPALPASSVPARGGGGGDSGDGGGGDAADDGPAADGGTATGGGGVEEHKVHERFDD